jgi:enediyne polyketide synthase
MTPPQVAIVGMACEYPDAQSPRALWENVLARRQAFRRLPPERLNLDDYFAPGPDAPDRTYGTEAAVIRDYAFDRVRFRVSGETFRAADPVHWLALDVAARALDDAGFPDGSGLPRETTGVYLGNTLTGDFSRAQTLRLRWPYVRRTIDAALAAEGWAPGRRREFLAGLETRYKEPFAPVGAETLAGGLSNTIAGRVCNHFNLQGGGSTVDGACASSLLAVAHACAALAAGDLDVALAGGVDLSLDPFELVGFAKAGALATEAMRVYDARSEGFWPGEGCGVVVMMRLDDARDRGRRVLATVPGWGVSSDGHGGITRPEVEGQVLALRRAYRRAGFGIGSVGYFEGHGTGTAVGDETELRALGRARREADPAAPPAAIGSVKANIGHTKAAAGAAGLIKAVMALDAQVVPPTTGCAEPHPELTGPAPALRVPFDGAPWPTAVPLRAGVSAMGFGGVNVHIVVEGPRPSRGRALAPAEARMLGSYQDAELFLFGGPDRDALRAGVKRFRERAAGLSRAELIDAAHSLALPLGPDPPLARAAVVAASPAELARRLDTLLDWLAGEVADRLDERAGAFLGTGNGAPRVGFLFPGQGSPVYEGGNLWARRFEAARRIYEAAGVLTGSDAGSTAVAQPAIVTAALAGLGVLDRVGVTAEVGVGHSLGELVAIHWGGAIDAPALVRLAAARGRAMADLGTAAGAMASVGADRARVEAMLDGDPVVIAGHNSPRQTVISGPATAVERVIDRFRGLGIPAVRLPVDHAFHSPLVAAAVPALAAAIGRERLGPLRRSILSTVTGAALGPAADLGELLCRQVTAPVLFREALAACPAVHLWIEVGPGRVLSGLASDCGAAPVVALDAGGPSLLGLLAAVGAAFAAGASVRLGTLFDDRFTRPFDLERPPRFFANPCELAPLTEGLNPLTPQGPESGPEPVAEPGRDSSLAGCRPVCRITDMIRQLVAERAELPVEAIRDGHRLLGDLHLNSITVSQLVIEATRRLGLAPPVVPNRFANVTVAEVADAMEEQARGGAWATEAATLSPPGIEGWVRPFSVEWVERPRPDRPRVAADNGHWRVAAPSDHPLAEELHDALSRAGGGGVLVALPPQLDGQCLGLLLDAAKAALATGPGGRFVVVEHGGGGVGAAFAKSLHLEAPWVDTVVIDVPPRHPRAVDWVVGETLSGRGYVEAHYDEDGRRSEPVLRHASAGESPADRPPVGPDDVILVTGGGKGIGAECALALARRTGARLGVLGRSRPETDAELAANLRRFQGAGAVCQYTPADVTRADEVRQAVAAVEAEFGPVTGVIHAAGVNEPRALIDLDEETLQRTVAPKVQGLRNVLAAVDPDRLRLLVTFGSVIARTGMRGEAHYALANAWQTDLTERFQAGHPACRCLALEWSVWASVGMGERLGRVEALGREGVGPIPTEAGADLFVRLVTHPQPRTALVVAGRLGDPPTIRIERPPLPGVRFLERILVDYPGVELVAEADLSSGADPYLNDHVFQGERLLPAVIGLEAMAQAAAGVTRADLPGLAVIEDVAFDRPIAVPDSGPSTIRLVALVRGGDRVEVALRCQATGYQVDHFRATFRPGHGPAWAARLSLHETTTDDGRLPLDPGRELYGSLLFQSGRYRRLRGYNRLSASGCRAEVTPADRHGWFGTRPEPPLLLGDPGTRDAAVHCVQACIPHATVLPISVDRIVAETSWPDGPRHVVAEERSFADGVFMYDLTVFDADGRPCERWEGLRLRPVGATRPPDLWPPALLAPYLERRIRELVPGAAVTFAVDWSEGDGRRARSGRAMARALGITAPVPRRPDGKPQAPGGLHASAAHSGGLTLAAAGPWPLGCDIEPSRARPADAWLDLLGPHLFGLARRLAGEAGDDLDAAATRVWTASESLQKLGGADPAALVHVASGADGWEVLRAGSVTVVVRALTIGDGTGPTAVAVALQPPDPIDGHGRRGAPPRAYEYRHVVGFEESNLVGNVYFVNYLRWQGRCREMFLRDHAPSVLEELKRDLVLVTTGVSCDFLAELRPFDEVAVRMTLTAFDRQALRFHFDYWRVSCDGEDLVARGDQTVAWMRRAPAGLATTPIPESLRAALEAFS